MTNTFREPPHKTGTAIIGGGFCGTLSAIHLLKNTNNPPQEITIIERAAVIGPGLAYSVRSESFKLNVPVSGMSPFEDQPNAFLDWLSKRRPTTTPDEFVARYHYGDYLNELLKETSILSNLNKLNTISDEVIDLEYDVKRDIFILRLNKGGSLLAERIILAIGNLPRRDLFGQNLGELLANPYELTSYNEINRLGEIVIIGTGLTSVDCLLECESRGFKGRYTMISRHAKLPLPHEAPLETPIELLNEIREINEHPRLRALISLVHRWSKRLRSSQPVIAALRPDLQRIWMRLSRADKGQFLRHGRSFWEIHRHRIPAPHHTTLERLKYNGRLKIVRGSITRIDGNSDASCKGVSISLKNGAEILGDRVFLCAGQEGDLARVQHPLVGSLLRSGIVSTGEFKLGISGGVGLPLSVQERFKVIGPLQREELWEITAVRELRVAASKLKAT